MLKLLPTPIIVLILAQACNTTTSTNRMIEENQANNINQQEEKYSEPLFRALDGKKLNLEDTSTVISECIEIGNKRKTYILQLMSEGYNNPIIVLGNTGCGKSTTISWLSGCTMVKGKVNGKEVVTVLPLSKGGSKNSITPIGHSRDKSETFIPIVVPAENGIIFIDCPGFLETRNPAISIANNINIKNLLNALNNFKILLLLDYPSINSARSKGTTDMIKLLIPFFGGEEQLLHHKNSIAIGITKINSHNNDGLSSVKKLVEYLKSDNQNIDLVEYINEEEDDLREEFEHCGIQEHYECNEKLDPKNVFKHFASRIFTFDPLGRNINGGLARDTLFSYMIENITPFQRNSAAKFITPLTAEDNLALSQIGEMTKIKILNKLKMKQKEYIPTLAEFSETALLVKNIERLKIIESPTIDELLEKIYSDVNYKLIGIEGLIKFKYSNKEFTEADQSLQNLEQAVVYFVDPNASEDEINRITDGINLPQLRALGAQCKEKDASEKRKEAEKDQRISNLEANKVQYEKEKEQARIDNIRYMQNMQSNFYADLKKKEESMQRDFDKKSAEKEHETHRENIITGLKTLISKAECASKGTDLVIKLHKTIEHVRCNGNIDFCEVSCGDDSMESFIILVRERYNIINLGSSFLGEILFKKQTTLLLPSWGLVFSYGNLKANSSSLLPIHLIRGLF